MSLPATSSADPWLVGRNEFLIQSMAFSLQSRDRFNLHAEKRPFFNDGRTKIYGIMTNLMYGITNRLNAGIQVPFIGYDFRDAVLKRAGSDWGDVQIHVKYQFFDGPAAISLQTGIKFPAAQDGAVPDDVQVGEDYYSYEAVGSVGILNFWKFSFMSLDAGYRYKDKARHSNTIPGSEFLFRFDNGVLLGRSWLISTRITGFSGGKWESFGLKYNNSEQRLFSVSASIIKGLTPRTGLVLNVTVPFAGKNFNAGSRISIGFFFYKGTIVNVKRSLNLPSVTCQSVCSI